MKIENLKLESHGDERGQLVALENGISVPFDIKRIYYIYDTQNNVHRGFHAHMCLKQLIVCVAGSCKIILDDGRNKKIVSLDNPTKGLYISGCIWREMFDFSPGAVLLVLASELYDESDYIRDYDEFIAYAKTIDENEVNH